MYSVPVASLMVNTLADGGKEEGCRDGLNKEKEKGGQIHSQT